MNHITVTISAQSDNGREAYQTIDAFATECDDTVAGYLSAATKDGVEQIQRYLDE
jgi:hypothetical protein